MDSAKADLFRALGRLVRGLTTLFWGIPLVLAVDVQTARTEWFDDLHHFAFAPALILSGILWLGLRRLRGFRQEERIWQQALSAAETLALVAMGFSPFLFWWRRAPEIPFFFVCVNFLAVVGYVFLMQINHVLRRLTAMLPDATLRVETRTFTIFNIWMLTGAVAVLGTYLFATDFHGATRSIGRGFFDINVFVQWLILFLTLMPIAVTLALLWKIKEAIFTSFFEVER